MSNDTRQSTSGTPLAIEHRHGGAITALKSIEHETYKGIAEWFFIGSVDWTDGSRSENARIYPHMLCGEPAILEPFLAQLNHYLQTAGEWHDRKEKRDGRIYMWTPKNPEGSCLVVQS